MRSNNQNATIGRQFMELMKDYMDCREYPKFNSQQGLKDLHADLENLYKRNKS